MRIIEIETRSIKRSPRYLLETSCNKHASTTSFLDSLFSGLREELGLDDDWDLGKNSLSENLEVARLGHVDDWYLILILGCVESGLLRNKGPKLVSVHCWGELVVSHQMEDSHSTLSEVAGMTV